MNTHAIAKRMRSADLAGRTLVLVMLTAGAGGTATAATPSEEDACRPDVFRLCVDAIPNEDAIVACLNRKTADLSAACRAVIDPKPVRAHKPRVRLGARG